MTETVSQEGDGRAVSNGITQYEKGQWCNEIATALGCTERRAEDFYAAMRFVQTRPEIYWRQRHLWTFAEGEENIRPIMRDILDRSAAGERLPLPNGFSERRQRYYINMQKGMNFLRRTILGY